MRRPRTDPFACIVATLEAIAAGHAPAKQRGAVAAMLKTIFAQETKADAVAQWEVVSDALREKQPKRAAWMDGSREDVLAYMDFPREHWPQIARPTPHGSPPRSSM
jgi:transposase-like protein